MLTLSSFRYNCFKVLQKKAEPRHSDDETPVKLGRTCVILSTPTIYHFFKKLGTNCKDMPARKNRAKGNRASVPGLWTDHRGLKKC